MVNRGQLLFGVALFALILSAFGSFVGITALVIALLNGGLTLVGVGAVILSASVTSLYWLYRWFTRDV